MLSARRMIVAKGRLPTGGEAAGLFYFSAIPENLPIR